MPIVNRVAEFHDDMTAWRRDIHAHPETAYEESRTADVVAEKLESFGIEVHRGLAKTGVVGHIEGAAGPTVGLRADMDALPIQEENGSEFDSQLSGLMHACGHDAHTAMLMGAATLLKGFADEGRLPGNVRLIFQPSEENRDAEGKSGGMRMVEEGALDNLDAVFGCHVDTRTVVGTIGTRPGPMMAAGDMFDLTITGFGGHGARPQLANDPILLASYVIQAVNHIVSRRIDPLEAGVISICIINAGTARNVIPESVKLAGTIRSMNPAIRQQLHEEMRKACAIVESLGGRYDLNILHGYPATVNDPEAADMALGVLNEMLGEGNAFVKEQIMASEDFSFMLQKAPGAFLRLGVKNPEWDREYPVHTSTFRMDEDALPVGAAALAACAVRWMQTKG